MEPALFTVGVAKVAFGVENDGVLVRLKASPTNCKESFPSLNLNVREMFSSTLKKPGPRRMSLPVLPRVPAAGLVNEAPLKYGVLASWPPRIWTTGLI